jgi:hypothetical protein
MARNAARLLVTHTKPATVAPVGPATVLGKSSSASTPPRFWPPTPSRLCQWLLDDEPLAGHVGPAGVTWSVDTWSQPDKGVSATRPWHPQE